METAKMRKQGERGEGSERDKEEGGEKEWRGF